jgi:hypothetical protein
MYGPESILEGSGRKMWLSFSVKPTVYTSEFQELRVVFVTSVVTVKHSRRGFVAVVENTDSPGFSALVFNPASGQLTSVLLSDIKPRPNDELRDQEKQALRKQFAAWKMSQSPTSASEQRRLTQMQAAEETAEKNRVMAEKNMCEEAAKTVAAKTRKEELKKKVEADKKAAKAMKAPPPKKKEGKKKPQKKRQTSLPTKMVRRKRW